MQAFPPQTPPPRRSPQAGRGGCTEPHAVGTVEAYAGTANADKARATLLSPVGVSHCPFLGEPSPSPAPGLGVYLHPSPSGRVSPALPLPRVQGSTSTPAHQAGHCSLSHSTCPQASKAPLAKHGPWSHSERGTCPLPRHEAPWASLGPPQPPPPTAQPISTCPAH